MRLLPNCCYTDLFLHRVISAIPHISQKAWIRIYTIKVFRTLNFLSGIKMLCNIYSANMG